MAFFKGEGILSSDFFESAVEVAQTFESAIEAGFANISVLKQEFFGFIDSIVVYKLSESKPRHFLKIAAKGSLAQESQLGGFAHLELALVIAVDQLKHPPETLLIFLGKLIFYR